jgi:diguanylate cyclase (GGDEF)-like protein
LSETDSSASASKPAAASARKGRGRSAPPRDPLKTFTWFIAFPTVAVYILICVLVLATLHLMTGEINRIDSDRGRKSIGAAFDSIALQLGEQVADEATWNEAYLNTYVDYNPAWLDSTWATTARADGHYDTVIVTDARGSIIFGESTRGPLTGQIAAQYSATAEAIAALDLAIAERGDDSSVSHLAKGGGGVSALAAAVIHGATGQMVVPAADRRILWLGKLIDEEMLDDIAHRFHVPVPRLAAEPPHGGDQDWLELTDVAGAPVGVLVWRPLRPGDAAFIHATSIASIILLIIGVLIFIVLYAFRRSVERRAESDERDWIGARFDPSTGLVNRFGLEESIVKLIRGRNGEIKVAMAYIEFEGLKDVAGSYGQETAEALLNHLADLIDDAVDRQAQIARLGPDEFALCRTGEDAGQMVRGFARSVIELVAEAIPLEDLRLKLGATIGVAETTVGRKTVGDIFKQATAALQRARETGGNHIVEHDPSLEVNRQRRLDLQADIRRGLDAEEFDLEYQPIIDFDSQALLGVEALLRWPRRTGGPMGPGEFIPAAEASGLIEELGLYALRRACRDIARYPQLKLSVNVSTVQFRSPTLASKIDSILSATSFPSQRLQLEITESFLLAQPDRAKAAIEELRGRGITIALDDFGTGFSSVGYLRQFRFDRVKLDRSLVDELDMDPVKTALVESTMVFAFAMGLAVTAEGVERREEAAVLARLGCREFQGYLFSKPLKLDALDRLMKQGEALRRAS